MHFWLITGFSIFFYIMGFIVNTNHDQVFSRASLHIRWWFSSLTIFIIGLDFLGISNLKAAILGLFSSILFILISWKTK